MASSRLREQLNCIRESITRFEQELAYGTDAKQRDLDVKFEGIRQGIDQISSAVDAEAKRVNVECADFIQRVSQTVTLCYEDLTSWWKATASEYQHVMISSSQMLANVDREVAIFENDKTISLISDSVEKLKAEVESLHNGIKQFAIRQDMLESEVVRKLSTIDHLVEQQINYWENLTEESIRDIKVRYETMFSEIQHEGEYYPHEVKNHLENGRTVPDSLFQAHVEAELRVLHNQVLEMINERREADNEIIKAADKYTTTLQKSLEATTQIKYLANEVMRES